MNILRLYAITMLFLSLIMLSGCMTVRLGLPTKDRADNPMANREFKQL